MSVIWFNQPPILLDQKKHSVHNVHNVQYLKNVQRLQSVRYAKNVQSVKVKSETRKQRQYVLQQVVVYFSFFINPNLLEYGKSSPTALAQTSYFQKDSEPPSPRLVTGISSHLYPVNLLTGPLLFLFLKWNDFSFALQFFVGGLLRQSNDTQRLCGGLGLLQTWQNSCICVLRTRFELRCCLLWRTSGSLPKSRLWELWECWWGGGGGGKSWKGEGRRQLGNTHRETRFSFLGDPVLRKNENMHSKGLPC